MTKNDLIKAVAEDTGMNKTEVNTIFDGLMATIRQKIIEGETITIQGFGTFGSKVAGARTGRNPQTGETLDIPSRWVPVMKPAQGLKVDLAARKVPKKGKK